MTGEDGKDEILHDPFEKEEDRAYLEKRVEKIMELIPEIDEKINEIAEAGEQDVWVKSSLRSCALLCLR